MRSQRGSLPGGCDIPADISVGDPGSGAVSGVTASGVQLKGNLIGQHTDPRTFGIRGHAFRGA